ncbi:hypothetical protein GCM10009623_34010 [Nocardioides aestuarii]|uniref:DUF732 domain-containing protein n=1 Tax=Nocardioides aestuarii TaxID=252231 RepID=A0ABW4TRF5_9ACTN
MKIRTIGVAAVLALALTSCGNDDQAAADAVAAGVMEGNDDTFQVTQEQADCLGEGMVDEIGTDQLIEYKIITKDLEQSDGIDSVKMSQSDAEAAAGVMQDCADIKKIFTDQLGDSVPEEAAACIDENLSDEVLNEFLVAVFMDDQEAGTQSLMGALQECLSA